MSVRSLLRPELATSQIRNLLDTARDNLNHADIGALGFDVILIEDAERLAQQLRLARTALIVAERMLEVVDWPID